MFFCGEDGHIVIEEQSPDDFDTRLGKQLGGYVLAARVADGAMGRVFEGRHPENAARVAIKVLHEDVARDRVAVERFRREFESADEMDHPYVVKVLGFGATGDGSHFMTMEYLEGQELSKAMHGSEPMPLPRAVRVLCQVASALEYAHSFGFIHRDLKPDNVFLCDSPDGPIVRILDFGSVKLQMETGSKLTAVGTTVGSPYYMSPEQATGAGDVDQRTDVFALGAIFYEMLTNEVAFEGPSLAMILMKIMNENPPPPSTISSACPVILDDVLERALHKNKDQRFGSAKAFADAVVKSVGLEHDGEYWANASEQELISALAAATPEKPKAFGARETPTPPSMPAPTLSERPRPPSSSVPMVVSIALGVMLLGGVVMYLMR